MDEIDGIGDWFDIFGKDMGIFGFVCDVKSVWYWFVDVGGDGVEKILVI